MYDFCLSYPYGALLIIGGMMGFITASSTVSLASGVLTGGLIFLFGRASHHFYKQGKLCKPATMASMFLSTFVGMLMFNRWEKTNKIFPGGIGAALSIFMTMFYMWSFFLGPEPKPSIKKPKVEKMAKKAKKAE